MLANVKNIIYIALTFREIVRKADIYEGSIGTRLSALPVKAQQCKMKGKCHETW